MLPRHCQGHVRFLERQATSSLAKSLSLQRTHGERPGRTVRSVACLSFSSLRANVTSKSERKTHIVTNYRRCEIRIGMVDGSVAQVTQALCQESPER